MNSPVRLGVSPATSTPTGFCSQRFCGFIFLHWNPGLYGLSCFPVVPPSLSTCKCGTAGPPATALLRILSAQLPVSTPPTGWKECFFFNSLVVGLLYSLIFWQFWVVFFFNLLSFFWLCEEGKYIYLCLHLGQKSKLSSVIFFNGSFLQHISCHHLCWIMSKWYVSLLLIIEMRDTFIWLETQQRTIGRKISGKSIVPS